MGDQKEMLQVINMGKSFDGNVVLKDVNFTLNKGEILGLVGENGAGKSTLMNILFGMSVIAETGGFEGKVLLDGKEVKFKNPSEALKAGIGMVHQEFSLIPGFSVSENILLNMENTKKSVISQVFGKKLETIDVAKNNQVSKTAIDTLGVEIDPKTLVSEMPVGHKQFIEIAREINKDNVKLLILDEPTAVLTESEADILLAALRRLADMGIAIVFISHRLREVITACDKIVVLRDGVVVKESSTQGVEAIDIASWMVGRDVENQVASEKKERRLSNEVVMDIKNLWVDMPGEVVHNVNLQIKKGEILGIGGLAGQGKLGIPNGILGLYPSGGDVLFRGENLKITDTKDMLRKGINFVSEDRRGVGLLLDEPISWNIAFNAMQVKNQFLKRFLLFNVRDEAKMNYVSEKYIDELEIRCTGPSQKARNLSGGNQQKVCLAKAFAMEPDLLFVSEPTRGIDVGAKKLVLDALRKHNEEIGTTIVVISSELEELRAISDRIAIVFEGKIIGILDPKEDIAKFGLLMAGEKLQEEVAING